MLYNSLTCFYFFAIQEPRVFVFKLYLHPACIFTSYYQLMKNIYDNLKKDEELVNGKLVTPKSGVFLVQLVPEKEDELPLTFPFGCSDLYMEGYHYNSKYFSLFSTIYFTFSLNSLE